MGILNIIDQLKEKGSSKSSDQILDQETLAAPDTLQGFPEYP